MSAILGGKPLRGGLCAEGHRLSRVHRSELATFDDIIGLPCFNPGPLFRVLPVACLRHVRDVNCHDIFGEFGKQQKRERISNRTEPERFRLIPNKNLPFRSFHLRKAHAAEFCGSRGGGLLRGRNLRFLLSAARKKRQSQAHKKLQKAAHICLRRNSAIEAASGTTTQSTSAAATAVSEMRACSASPDRPEKRRASGVERRFSVRKASAGLSSKSQATACAPSVRP